MLAIVIPYYKHVFFEETLKCLANQTDKRFKVYIGDDASPESPTDLLEKFKNQFDFVYHRFEENLGGISLTKQWERCIALSADEEWIMILGDDDVLGENVVEEFYSNLPEISKEKINVVRFSTKIINEYSTGISDIFIHPKFELAEDSWYRKFEGKSRSSLSEYIFTRNSYINFGFTNYPLAWHSDDKAWFDFSNNKPIFTINKSIVFVRLFKESITGNQNNIFFKHLAEIQFLKEFILKKTSFFSEYQQQKILNRYDNVIKWEMKNLYMIIRYDLLRFNFFRVIISINKFFTLKSNL